MKIEVDPEDIYEAKADHRGRISLPASEYKKERWRVAVIEKIQEKDDGEGES